MSRLNKTDLELLYTGQNIDLSKPEYAYLGGMFDATGNGNDYVEVLIYDTNENFLESAVVDSTDYVDDVEVGIKLKTGTILRKLGYDRGRYVVKYNFLRKVAGSYENILVNNDNTRYTGEFDPNNETDRAKIGKSLFIKEYKYFAHEISPSRHEIRLVSDSIKEPENSQKYLRDFYDMQRITKKVVSTNTNASAIKFVPGNTNHEQSYELEMIESDNFFTPDMVGGKIIINKAFVREVIIPIKETGWGAGTNPLAEVQSTNLVARFAITNLDNAQVTHEGDDTLSVLYEKFKGLSLDSPPPVWDAIQKIGNKNNVGDILDIAVTRSGVGGWLFKPGSNSSSTIEISSISKRNLNSPATYVWQMIGFDEDKEGLFKDNSWTAMKTNEGHLLAGGASGVRQDTFTWTDHDVGTEGSKVAIVLTSNQCRVGLRLNITNDTGQEDEIIIPVFLETEDA